MSKLNGGATWTVNLKSGRACGEHSMSTNDKNYCEELYDAVFNSNVDTCNGQEGNNVASSGSEDEALTELAKKV